MNGYPRRLLATALLALGLAAGLTAPAAAATDTVSPVRLLAPAEGTVLAAGSLATLDWAPADSIAELAPGGTLAGERWDEWEAFLSLDGGASYPVRLTPHLDRELRRVTFRVPDLPTRNGRLLLRVGDERQETAFELPRRLTIVPRSGAPEAAVLPRLPRRGEPARPGEPGVLAWAEGSRQGGPVREVIAEDPGEPLGTVRARPGFAPPSGTSLPAAVSTAAPPSGAPAADPGIPSILPSPRAHAGLSARAPRPRAADLLLLLQRRNE